MKKLIFLLMILTPFLAKSQDGGYDSYDATFDSIRTNVPLVSPASPRLPALNNVGTIYGYVTGIQHDFISDWATATSAFLTGYTETDPIYSAWDKSTGVSIDHTQITDWATATASFLTGETDPVYSAWDKSTGISIDHTQISDWATATAAFLTGYTETDPIYSAWDKSTGISIDHTQISDWATATASFLTGNQTITISGAVTGTGTTAITTTLASDIVNYGNVATALKDSISDNDGAWDFSGNGIIYATTGSNLTVTFSNLQRKKTVWIKLVLSAAVTITWPSYCDVSGDLIDAAATYRIYASCWSATSGGEDVHISIRKIQ